MEFFTRVIDLLFFITIIALPFLVFIALRNLNRRQQIVYYFLIGIILSSLLIYFFAWWVDASNIILLKYYGYNLQGINIVESYENVLPQNIQKVKNIEKSLMGIGWPLKAIFGFIIFIPYLLAVFFGRMIWKKRLK
ncbi:MAG: hypothetical protein Q4G63_12535 [Bacteroidia bacterium]|nr:hypothetical protein [Bacteroidia bacterium]